MMASATAEPQPQVAAEITKDLQVLAISISMFTSVMVNFGVHQNNNCLIQMCMSF